MPKLVYTEEETELIAESSANISSLVDASLAEFITGQRKLDDAGWNAYLAELDSLGLQEWLECAQAAYDRVYE